MDDEIPHYSLGKLPAVEGAIQYQFSWFFSKPDLPTPPKVFGVWQHFWNISSYQNQRIGNCVFAGFANETASWYHDVKKWVRFTDENVISDYTAVSGYDPDKVNPKTGKKPFDPGASMAKAAEYRRTIGIADHNNLRHKVDAYVALRKGDYDDLRICMYLFGAVGIGLEYPEHAHIQFHKGQRWTVQNKSKMMGGHYVSGMGIDQDGDIVVTTWGKYHKMSREFYETYSDEACGYFSIERLMNRTSPEGFLADKLIEDLRTLKTPLGYSGFSY